MLGYENLVTNTKNKIMNGTSRYMSSEENKNNKMFVLYCFSQNNS